MPSPAGTATQVKQMLGGRFARRIKIQNNRFLKICWLFPLSFGLCVFIVWLVTRMDFLMFVGVLALCIGLFFTFMGIILGLYQVVKKHRNKKELIGLVQLLVLILMNIPIALGIVLLSIRIQTAYTVEIYNATDEKLENVCIVGGGIEENIQTINQKEKVRRTFWIRQDGTLICKYRKGDTDQTMVISGYVTNEMGGKDKVTIE